MLIGRERETHEIRERLCEARLVTLTGTGGVGKTRLAIQVATEVAEEYPEGVWFVDLAALGDPGLVPQTVASVLGVRDAVSADMGAALTALLGSRQLLLVLDNCEHLVAACAQLAQTLLQSCPHLRILATSRQSLGLTGEVAWRVPSLSLPAPREGSRVEGQGSMADGSSLPHRPLTLDPRPSTLLQSDAVRLFVERADAIRPGFTLTEANAAVVLEICRQLDGIPLALELAAARLRALSVEEIAARLDDRFRLLAAGSRTALPRQQTLRATLDWSCDLLSEPERVLLRRLSVFAGAFTLGGAEAVCADGEVVGWWGGKVRKPESSFHHPTTPPPHHLTTGDILDLLTSLVDKSLVAAVEQGGVTRYRLLETTRAYADEHLAAAGETHAVRQRHAEHFLAFAERAEAALNGPEQAEWLERLEAVHDNLRAALQWWTRWQGQRPEAEGSEQPTPTDMEHSLRLAGALRKFWHVRGYASEGRRWLEKALSIADGRLRGEASAFPSRHPKMAAARARALGGAGLLASMQRDSAAARPLLEESLAIYEALGDSAQIAWALNGLASWAQSQGDFDTARVFYERSLAIRRQLGDRLDIAGSLNNLGTLAYVQGEYATARLFLRESLAIHREMENRAGVAYGLQSLGEAALCEGDCAAARPLLEECLEIFRALGYRRAIVSSLQHLGAIAIHEGDSKAARGLLEESLASSREMGNRGAVAHSLWLLGDQARVQGEYPKARVSYEESLAILRETGHKPDIAQAFEGLAKLAATRIPDFAREPDAGSPPQSLNRERDSGVAATVARLFGAAEALRDAAGVPLPPVARAEYDRGVAAARAALGDAAFAAAWAAGRAMPLEEAFAEALSENTEEQTTRSAAGLPLERGAPGTLPGVGSS